MAQQESTGHYDKPMPACKVQWKNNLVNGLQVSAFTHTAKFLPFIVWVDARWTMWTGKPLL